MKKSAHSFRRPNRAAAITLLGTLGMLAGCSGGDATGVDQKVLSDSDVVLIKSTAKTPQDFRKAVRLKAMESEGVVVPTGTAGKAVKKAH